MRCWPNSSQNQSMLTCHRWCLGDWSCQSQWRWQTRRWGPWGRQGRVGQQPEWVAFSVPHKWWLPGRVLIWQNWRLGYFPEFGWRWRHWDGWGRHQGGLGEWMRQWWAADKRHLTSPCQDGRGPHHHEAMEWRGHWRKFPWWARWWRCWMVVQWFWWGQDAETQE